MATTNAFPTLTVAERDRRHAEVRERLAERGVSCVIVTGSNLAYMSNRLPGGQFGVLATADLPFYGFINGRHLVDVPASTLEDAQDWVKHIRPATGAGALVDLISEWHLDSGTIGFSPTGVTQAVYAGLTAGLPGAEFVDVSDIFADLRAIKSDEEVAMIAQSNRVFDAAIQAVHATIRPGILGKELVQAGIKAMWEAGGDLDTTFSINFGPIAKQNPILASLCLERPVQEGDLATLTAHAHFGGYGGHSDQEISVGTPNELHRDMFEAVLHTRKAVMAAVKPGVTQLELVGVYQQACAETGFLSSSHSQIHQYGIDVPEFPGPSFGVKTSMDGFGRVARGRNFVLAPGMIYSISPTIVAEKDTETVLGGTSLVVTETGYRELTDRNTELLVANG